MVSSPADAATRQKAKLRKLVAILGRRRWRRGLLRGVAAGVEHRAALSDLEVATVVDVGAHRGQFALFAREAFPRARIHAVEPQSGPTRRFRVLFANDPNVTLAECALAPVAGPCLVNVAGRDDSSSLLPIGEAQKVIFPGTRPVGTAVVRAAPLADILDPGAIRPPALLKVDVQGFEREALAACGPLLERFTYVYCECSDIPLYVGQALRPEVERLLALHGFAALGLYNTVVHPTLGAVQSDVLFARAGLSPAGAPPRGPRSCRR